MNVAFEANQKKLKYFSEDQIATIDFSKTPKHIAIIPDGNRRWAKKRLAEAISGHQEGADTLIEITKAAQELNIKALTFYCFSTENWNRSSLEIAALMLLFNTYLNDNCEEMLASGIKLETIGAVSSVPTFLQETIARTCEMTKNCNKISLILAINYGSRDEMCRAFQAMLKDYDKQLLKADDINEKTVSRYLDTCKWDDPELLIRTSGEMRVSNFLLWQISYTEIHASAVFWPDFKPKNLFEAVQDYQKRQRRWGAN